MKALRLLLLTAAALGLWIQPGTASAFPCNGDVTEIATPAGTFYIDDRGVDEGNVWIYMESNGTVGLQSGGQSAILGDLDEDECGEPGTLPDTLLI